MKSAIHFIEIEPANVVWIELAQGGSVLQELEVRLLTM